MDAAADISTLEMLQGVAAQDEVIAHLQLINDNVMHLAKDEIYTSLLTQFTSNFKPLLLKFSLCFKMLAGTMSNPVNSISVRLARKCCIQFMSPQEESSKLKISAN